MRRAHDQLTATQQALQRLQHQRLQQRRPAQGPLQATDDAPAELIAVSSRATNAAHASLQD